MGMLKIFHELQNSWFSPSFVHQKNRWLNLLGNCEQILNIQKITIEMLLKMMSSWMQVGWKKGVSY